MLNRDIVMPETGVKVTLYLTNNDSVEPDRKRPLVLLCPGGGYKHRVPHEGEPVALRLLAAGIQVAIVHYSCAPAVWPQALNELAETMVYAREHAAEWYADPDKIATMGFSAGAHEAAALGVCWHALKWGEACRPDAMILGYPVITAGEHRHDNSFRRLLGEDYPAKMAEVSLENLVDGRTPPTFLWHTWEDEVVPVENSLLFAAALRRAGVACEMHIYQRGRHSTGMGNSETCRGEDWRVVPAIQNWPDMAARWLKEL